MDVARTVREVRRRQGWSQRELARRAGVPARTVAALEAGERQATLAVLERLLGVAGLELSADLPARPLADDVRRHLCLSLTQRLHRALGGDGHPLPLRPLPVWRQLRDLTARGLVVLHGDAALALWLPPARPVSPVQVCLRPGGGGSGDGSGRGHEVSELDVLQDCTLHPPGLVQVGVDHRTVHVEAPADLALHLPQRRAELRGVSAVLHDEAARDEAGRRVRAHRDPAHRAEAGNVFHTKRFGSLPVPPEADRRGWRLYDDASLRAWLRRHGYPA